MVPIGALVCLLALPVEPMTCVPLKLVWTMFVLRRGRRESHVTTLPMEVMTASVADVQSSMSLTLPKGCQSAVSLEHPRTTGMVPIGALVCLLALPVEPITCVPVVHALTMCVHKLARKSIVSFCGCSVLWAVVTTLFKVGY